MLAFNSNVLNVLFTRNISLRLKNIHHQIQIVKEKKIVGLLREVLREYCCLISVMEPFSKDR